jgi:hypothetical protein
MKKILLIVVVITMGSVVSLTARPQVKAVVQAALNVNLDVNEMIPNASYYLKITKEGGSIYSPVSSCQMALEKAYDLLKDEKVEEVRIVSEYATMNGSCRNKTYTQGDLADLKKRRDS